MTEAEKELLAALGTALLNGRDDEESILAVFQDGEYFSHNGRVFKVVESEWLDSVDNCSGYTIWMEEVDE
jgi:hypothetical protein